MNIALILSLISEANDMLTSLIAAGRDLQSGKQIPPERLRELQAIRHAMEERRRKAFEEASK